MFPTTRASAVSDLGDPDPRIASRARAVIAEVYWRPLYLYVRLRHHRPPADAEDLTQGFFATALHRDALASYDPGRGRFRTFLRRCVDRYVIDVHRRERAARRDAGVTLDFAAAEREVATASAGDPDAAFEAAWLRHLVTVARDRTVATLIAKARPVHAALFEAFHGDAPPSYAAAAAAHGITVTDVTNWLAYARREFRRTALELLRELCHDDAEFVAEAKAVFGLDVTP